jgi:hypothetical protein
MHNDPILGSGFRNGSHDCGAANAELLAGGQGVARKTFFTPSFYRSTEYHSHLWDRNVNE